MSSPLFRQYRAPQQHGSALIDPDVGNAAELIAENRRHAERHQPPWLVSLRNRGREQLLADAIRYTSEYREPGWAGVRVDETPFVLSGHQPALFHPGVWFKNFALSRIGSVTGAVPINLVVDNDVAAGSSIRVPVFDANRGAASYVSVSFDSAGGGVPYEQAGICDRDIFESFEQRVAAAIAPLVSNPCIDRLWHHARPAVERCGIAGCALAQARHGLEGELGLKTLEVPLSVVSRSTPFAEFVIAILRDLPRFRECYNHSADEYRALHQIRSMAHPVPNLGTEGEWQEAPLWIYGDDAPQRRAVWVRRTGTRLTLSDRGTQSLSIDLRDRRDAAEQLSAAASPTFKLRPRALLTTMYARLVLSDLFLHGIGGAKYDQLGDLITQRFFSIPTPVFMVISATMRLADYDPASDAEVVLRCQRRIRETRFHGERFADTVTLSSKVVRRKRELLNHVPPRGEKKRWHDEINALNQQLSKALTETRRKLQEELVQARRDGASRALLGSREHAFCLFPLDQIRGKFDSLLSPLHAPRQT